MKHRDEYISGKMMVIKRICLQVTPCKRNCSWKKYVVLSLTCGEEVMVHCLSEFRSTFLAISHLKDISFLVTRKTEVKAYTQINL